MEVMVVVEVVAVVVVGHQEASSSCQSARRRIAPSLGGVGVKVIVQPWSDAEMKWALSLEGRGRTSQDTV
jgi:hypothetical protein